MVSISGQLLFSTNSTQHIWCSVDFLFFFTYLVPQQKKQLAGISWGNLPRTILRQEQLHHRSDTEGDAAGCPADLQVCQVAPLDIFLQVFLFHEQPCHSQMLLLFYCLCPDSQALGTDGQDHNEDSDQECHHGPEEAVQENSLIMGALQHHIIWPAQRRNRRWRKYKSA